MKEMWEASKPSNINVMSYVLQMREKMEQLPSLIRGSHLEEARSQQKTWYDQNTRERSLKDGDQVLVLLPTSAAKLEAQWQGQGKISGESTTSYIFTTGGRVIKCILGKHWQSTESKLITPTPFTWVPWAYWDQVRQELQRCSTRSVIQ